MFSATESVRQSLGDFFHRKHRLTGRKACCRRSLNIHSAQAVETLQTRGTELPLSRAESGERNHFAFIVAHVPAVQVFRTLTELLIALNINLLNTAAVVEGVTPGQAMLAMEEIAKALPHGFGIAWNGISFQEQQAGSQTGALYTLSILIVFLCLAALYESWSIPIAVILVVPLGVSVLSVDRRLRYEQRRVLPGRFVNDDRSGE